MPFRQTPKAHTPYVILAFDKRGVERTDDPDGNGGLISTRILEELRQSPPTDLFIFSHGWQGDIDSAIGQYDTWIDALMSLTADAGKMGAGFRPARIGLHWPSKPWGDEKIASVGAGPSFAVEPGSAGQAQVLEDVLERLGLNNSLRGRELVGQIFRENDLNPAQLSPVAAAAYRELAQLIGFTPTDEGENPNKTATFDPEAAFERLNASTAFAIPNPLSGVTGLLGQFTFWTMKQRARTVGEGGMYQFVGQAQQAAPQTRIHLIGHSFGCIVASSIAAGPGGITPLPRPVDTLTLLQGALSMWAYADVIQGVGGKGYYNRAIHRPAVRGPILTTRSSKDIAVNVWYPAAVALVVQNPSFGINPNLIRWGAIGAFGIQGVPGANDLPMQPETSDYHFENGKIYNLEASQYIAKMEGASGAHSDVYEPQVMHAIWQSVFTSSTGVAAFPAHVGAVNVMRAGVGAEGVSSTVPPPPPLTLHTVVPAAPAILSGAQPLTDKDAPIPFGVHAATGELLPPVSSAALSHIVPDPSSVGARSSVSFGLGVMFNADDLSKAGWAVVFAPSMPDKDAIRGALDPLLKLRQEQAGELFKVFDGPTGYNGQSAFKWVEDNHGSSIGLPVVPKQGVPYYILLVGPPDSIPFEFQFDLDVTYAVGRLYFRTPEEYAIYAKNMEAFERDKKPQNRVAAFFNTRNPGDRATALLHDQVALPLLNGSPDLGIDPLGKSLNFATTKRFAGDASKAELLKLLRGQAAEGAPSLLYTGSHGVDFTGDPRQVDLQGALLTQDWSGGGVNGDMYFTADDLPTEAKTTGLIHYMFACYGVGCPQFDTYSGTGGPGRQISASSFVARLPQKLLLSGAQAIIGHIDRAFAFSFQNSVGQPMVQGFLDPMFRILQGRRVGDAMDIVDQRWSVLSSELLQMINNRQALPGAVSDNLLANRWVARDDARNYIVLGDPAARLQVASSAPSTAASAHSFDVSISSGSGAPAPAFDVPGAVEFGMAPAHIEDKPTLDFKDFSGAIQLQAAVSPDCSYQLVAAAMETAGATVDAYIYSISAPWLMQLLADARDRGVKVRVMYDPSQMPKDAVAQLGQMGLDVKVAPCKNPRRVFTVCHQKFVVIDGRTVLLESANWDRNSIPEREAGDPWRKGNREWVIRADHEDLAEWYGTLFQKDWDIPAIEEFAVAVVPEVAPISFRAPSRIPDKQFLVTSFRNEIVTIRPLTSPDNYLDTILALLQTARTRIWLQQQYVEGKGGPGVPRLLEVIASRQSQGVDVRIITSSKFPKAWDATKETLKDAGLDDTLRAINLDNFTHCHNKGVIVDDAVVVSSTNWSQNSLAAAREAGMLIHSQRVTDYFAGVFQADWDSGWTVSTADNQIASFSVSAAAAEDNVEMSPADLD